MEFSQKLQKVLERLDNRVKALQVAYYDKLTEDACLYYFYYNENNDPRVEKWPFYWEVFYD